MSQPRKRRQQDPVQGLLTGKWVKRRDHDGKEFTVFQPFKRNPNPTLDELRKIKGSRFSEDEILTYENLRQLPLKIDYDCFSKSDAEKAKLKKVIKEHKSTLVKAGFNPSQRLNTSEPMVLGGFKSLRTLNRA